MVSPSAGLVASKAADDAASCGALQFGVRHQAQRLVADVCDRPHGADPALRRQPSGRLPDRRGPARSGSSPPALRLAQPRLRRQFGPRPWPAASAPSTNSALTVACCRARARRPPSFASRRQRHRPPQREPGGQVRRDLPAPRHTGVAEHADPWPPVSVFASTTAGPGRSVMAPASRTAGLLPAAR